MKLGSPPPSVAQMACCYRRLLLWQQQSFDLQSSSWCAGECFCLLGPNGAGKSTTINCLIGLLPVTAGEALVHDSSIRSPAGLAKIRGLIGVCPQFDVLWGDLTGREHLLLFGAIKGIPKQQAEQQADALLDRVSPFCQLVQFLPHEP